MNRRFSTLILVFLCIAIFTQCTQKNIISVDLTNAIVQPKAYVTHKTSNTIIIDGKQDENDWKLAKFTDAFIDIEGVKIPTQQTKVKMLWDDSFLYVFAKLEEKHIWGDITKRDAVIFYNNDFEVFINPSNTTQNYGEIEINALGTVWDLLLNKPYRFGGKAKNHWNLPSLKSAVFIKGTLNNSTDIDEYWSVEMAIPLTAFVALKNRPKIIPKDGEQWRINFSRVQWDHDIIDKKYARKKVDKKFLPEYNWVWSNQGAINMHIPENWGYLQFSEKNASEKVSFSPKTDIISEQITYALFNKIAFKDLKKLKQEKAGTIIHFSPLTVANCTLEASFLKTFSGFTILTENKTTNMRYIIKEDGAIIRKKLN